MKKKIFTGLLILSNLLLANAQNTAFNNIAIGLDAPDWGINIKTNFPGLTGSWSRGFFISNETGSQHLFSIGANGNSVNGISSFASGFIGTDWKNQFMSFLPNGNIGIGTEIPLVNLHLKSQTTHLRIESSDAGYNASIQYVSGGQYRWELGTGIQSGPNFELYDRINNKSSLVATPEGNVGIGTTKPLQKFVVSNEGAEGFEVYLDKPLSIVGLQSYNRSLNSLSKMQLEASQFSFMSGNVGIGTTNPTAKLTVAGDINSREVRVTVNAGADFVFENDYDLPSLTSVEAFIKENKHLPEIASAKEMQENGINLSEMNIKLLQKIEELTLYTIEQNKNNLDLKQKVEKLEKENEGFKSLSERLSKIENQLK